MKNWFDSKSIWINGLTGIASIVGIFTTSSLFTSQQVGYMVLALAIINVILRFLTKEPIGSSTSPLSTITASSSYSSVPTQTVNPQ